MEDLRGLSTPAIQEMADRRQTTNGNASTTLAPSVPSPPAPPPPQLDPRQQRVYDALTERRHADELARALELAVGDLARLLMQLEMKKAVRRLPGNFYERR